MITNNTGQGNHSEAGITEGLPPVSTKLMERIIQKWEFIELASLFTHGAPTRSGICTITQDNHARIQWALSDVGAVKAHAKYFIANSPP